MIRITSFLKDAVLSTIGKIKASGCTEYEIEDCPGFYVASEKNKKDLLYLDIVQADGITYYVCQNK